MEHSFESSSGVGEWNVLFEFFLTGMPSVLGDYKVLELIAFGISIGGGIGSFPGQGLGSGVTSFQGGSDLVQSREGVFLSSMGFAGALTCACHSDWRYFRGMSLRCLGWSFGEGGGLVGVRVLCVSLFDMHFRGSRSGISSGFLGGSCGFFRVCSSAFS